MNNQRLQRQLRTRRKLQKGSDKIRLSVFRSNKYLYAQLIDDTSGKTVASLSEKALSKKGKTAATRMDNAKELGISLAKIALDKKIKEVVFDKGRYAYHGKIKQIAEGAREGGLKF